ncbi:MAG: hypothetical protein AAF847_16420 [Bacteroidota bacterium]
MKSLYALLFLALLSAKCNQQEAEVVVDHPPHESFGTEKPMEGLTFVAPPNPFPQNPMPPIQEVGADWIALVPYAFTRQNNPQVFYGSDRQWWGERVVGIEESIRLAREAGIKVMLKPQVYIPGSWTGDMDYAQASDWESWEKGYDMYILLMAELAEKYQVELFCVGTEFKIGAKKRESYWRNLIREIRDIYSGKLVYAANWDAYPDIPFWDALDYVGINAYFPLVDQKTPTVKSIKSAWRSIYQQIEDFQQRVDRPIIFTEYGYLSVDGCTYNTWELESKVRSLPINEQAQANAYQALFETFWEADWWQGGFLWKWFPNMQGGEGYDASDYTPQGKMGAETLQKWYFTE